MRRNEGVSANSSSSARLRIGCGREYPPRRNASSAPNRTLAFGPDGMLYISAGSTCNVCNESNPENATLLRATPDGTQIIDYGTAQREEVSGHLIGFTPEQAATIIERVG